MQIFNSLTNFFNPKETSEKNEFVSESSTKVQFKDYLHDAMDEAVQIKNEEIPIKPDFSQTKLESNLDLKKETKFETSFKFELSKLETSNEINSNFVEKQFEINEKVPQNDIHSEEEPAEEIEDSTDEKDLVPDEISNSNKEESNEDEIKIENEEINFSKKDFEQEKIIKQEPTEFNLNKEEIDSKEPVQNIPEELKVQLPFKNEEKNSFQFEKTNLSEPKEIQIPVKEELKSIEIKPQIAREENSSKKIETPKTSFELLKQNFDSTKEIKFDLAAKENLVLEIPLLRENQVKETNKKDKKDKDLVSKTEAKETKEVNPKIEIIKQELIKKTENEDSIVQSKWNITKKDSISTEPKKEAMISLKEMLSAPQKNEEKQISTSIQKIESDSKQLDKPKEIKLDKENFQKSLNELVQKAKLNIVENGKNTAQISLYPNELGKITLNIDVIKERVEGKILVDNEIVKNLLLSDFSILKEDLKQSGLNLSSLTVEVKTNEEQLASFFNFEKNENFEKNNSSNLKNSNSKKNDLDLEQDSETEKFYSSNKLVDVRV